MKAFEDIIQTPLQGRVLRKPRNQGLTMVIDTGVGLRTAEDYCELAGDYIDIIKLGFGTSRLVDVNLLKRKIALYKNYQIDVEPGGTFLEIAYKQNMVDKYLDKAKEFGFTAIEVSDGTVEISEEDRVKLIRKALEKGFKVLAEVGKKIKEKDLSGDEIAQGVKRDLQLGVYKVIIEARESGRGVGLFDEKGEVVEEKFEKAIRDVSVENLIFEAPLKDQQAYLIKRFGPNVNLGNIHFDDVIPLECLRQGLRSDTLRLVYK